MKTVCAWCFPGLLIIDGEHVSHGICAMHRDKLCGQLVEAKKAFRHKWLKGETCQKQTMSTTTELLRGIEALTRPDYHKLNVNAGRNDRLLHAVLCAYAKHVLDAEEIGWEELGYILHSAICNEIGDDAFQAWSDGIKPEEICPE